MIHTIKEKKLFPFIIFALLLPIACTPNSKAKKTPSMTNNTLEENQSIQSSTNNNGDSPLQASVKWIGVQSVQIGIISKYDNTIGIMIRNAKKPAPQYNDIKDKKSFLKRFCSGDTETEVFTSMHYGTKNDIAKYAPTQGYFINKKFIPYFMQPATSYNTYFFDISTKKIIQKISFTTLPVPSVSKVKHNQNPTSLYYYATFPQDPKETPLTVKKGDLFLLPMYINVGALKLGLTFQLGRSDFPFSAVNANIENLNNYENIAGAVALNRYHPDTNDKKNGLNHYVRFLFVIPIIQDETVGDYIFSDADVFPDSLFTLSYQN